MEQENQAAQTPNEGENGAKKQSKHFLVVYIIGLFSVALVLILLSYVTQVRANRQLVTLQNQVSEQTTVAQGAQQQMSALQATVQEQEKKLEVQDAAISEVRKRLNVQEDEKMTDAVALLEERYVALDALQQVRRLSETGDDVTCKELLTKMVENYGKDRLLPPEEPSEVLLGQNSIEFFNYCARYGIAVQ